MLNYGLPLLLAWQYSINHRETNVVGDFDSPINFLPKEYFTPDHMNTI